MAAEHDEIGQVRCEVTVPSLREWADADHPPSPLTWHREFVPALRDLLAENERFRGALERIAKEPAPGSTISCRNIAKAALSGREGAQ